MSIIEKAMNKVEAARHASAARRSDIEDEPSTKEEVAPAEPMLNRAVEKLAPAQTDLDRTQADAEAGGEVAAAYGREDHRPETGLAFDASSDDLIIPFAELSELGMITPQTPRSQIAEEFRTIKRPLLHNISDTAATQIEYSNLIMVTSALQGDGKTFSAINLALSIAMEQDRTVLFVDADVAKASAGRLLGVPDHQPGLIDLLDGSVSSPAEVILKTNVQNLRVLPAGNVHERSTELLASNDMRRLMVEFSKRYSDRVIVFDSPPLLLTTEAGVLTTFMGQIVFVVSADYTPPEAIKTAISHIGRDKVIGMVLNRARHGIVGPKNYKYGYSAGYGYGSRADSKA